MSNIRRVIAVGDSRDEAVEFHLKGMREEDISIPPPASFAGVVEISSAAL